MRIWGISLMSLLTVAVISYPAYTVVLSMASDEQRRTEDYLSIRIEDVPIEQLSEHIAKIERTEDMGCRWVEELVREAVRKYPEGTLFFFNTSQEQWRALGGEMGYAIILKGRIVWKRRLKIS
jgi:hypothetical protein